MTVLTATIAQVPVQNNPYTSLKDINDVDTKLSTFDRETMRQLHQVLRERNQVDRFGMTLLHDHFEVNDGETMIETHNPVTREITIKPYRNVELKESEGLMDTSWRFDNTGEPIALFACTFDWDTLRHKSQY